MQTKIVMKRKKKDKFEKVDPLGPYKKEQKVDESKVTT